MTSSSYVVGLRSGEIIHFAAAELFAGGWIRLLKVSGFTLRDGTQIHAGLDVEVRREDVLWATAQGG